MESITKEVLDFLHAGGTGITIMWLMCVYVVKPLIAALAERTKTDGIH
jgi:hypothetical protein